MPQGFASVDELFGALHAARDADDEGGLSILDHGLQCADLIRAARPDDVELQVAGLVHDLGWLERAPGGWTLRPDAAHDVDGQPTRATRARAARRVPRRWSRRREALPARDRRRVPRAALGAERDHARVPGWRDGTRRDRGVRGHPGVGRPGRAPPRRRRRQGPREGGARRSMPGPARSRRSRPPADAAAIRRAPVRSRSAAAHRAARRSSAPSRRLRPACRAAPGPAVRPRGAHRATTATCARVRGPPCVPRRVSSPVNPKARPGSLHTRQHSSASEWKRG